MTDLNPKICDKIFQVLYDQGTSGATLEELEPLISAIGAPISGSRLSRYLNHLIRRGKVVAKPLGSKGQNRQKKVYFAPSKIVPASLVPDQWLHASR